MIQIFNNQTTDGDSLEFTIDDVNPSQKQDPFIGIVGNFDGAIVKLQWKDPDGNWYDTDSTEDSWTDVVRFPVFLDSFSSYKLTVSGAGAATDISSWVFGGKLA